MSRPHFVSALRNTAWILAAGVVSSAAVAQSSNHPTRQELVSAGDDRHYLLHVPADYAGEAIPLVINFHGSLLVPENQVEASGFGAIADREGFAVAYPAGEFQSGNMQRSWNADVDSGGVDDVQLVRDIVDDVAGQIDIDRSRIYVTGFSGGGRISSRLACELSDLLAAAAPVAGLQYYADCAPAQPIPILAIHSKRDPFNHYEHSTDSPAYWHVGVETAIEKWRAANGCATQAEVTAFADNVERRAWTDCRDGSEIVLYAVDDDKHEWPGFASEVVWAFFSRH